MRTPRLQLLQLSIASIALSIPCWASASGAGWEPGPKKQGNGYAYQVFTLQKEGEPFLRYQVRGTIDAPPDVVQSAASRVSTDPARAPADQKRTVLYKDRNETVMLTEIDLPGPLADRDVVTRGRSSVDPATGVRRIDFESTDEKAPPPKEGVIRLDKTGGGWVFAPDGEGRSKVTFETYVDLGGSLPGWLVEGQMESTAAGSFEKVAVESIETASRSAVSAPGTGSTRR